MTSVYATIERFTGLRTHDGAEIIIRPCYSHAYWSESVHASHDIGPCCSVIRPAWLVCPGVRPPRTTP